MDAIVLTVAHDQYKKIDVSSWESMLKTKGLLIDVKSTLSKKSFENSSLTIWRL